jgi:SAM-dependent methyltransferase
MSGFAISGDAYGRFMGRFSEPLAGAFLEWSRPGTGTMLDVGCGPGALTAALAGRVGAEKVSAVDPEEHFLEACRQRVPGVDARRALAEDLPYDDGQFGAALSQLVLHFAGDPERAAEEMARVVRSGGVVSACTWAVRGMGMLNVIWDAAEGLAGPAVSDAESRMRMRTVEELAAVFEGAGLQDVETTVLEVEGAYEGFEDFWTPVTNAAGPVGAFYARLGEDQRAGLRERVRERLDDPQGPFTLSGRACAARGRTP